LLKNPSISLRLTAWVSAIFLFGFVVFGMLTWLDLKWALSKGRDKTLSNRARRLVELFDSLPQDTGRLESKVADFQDATPEGNLIQVFDARGRRLFPPIGKTFTSVPWPEVDRKAKQSYHEIEMQGRPFRVFTRAARVRGQLVRIFVAGQLEDNRLLLARFTDGLVWTIPALLVLSGLAGYFVSRRALNPIDRFIESARLISIGNLSRRLPLSQNRDEMTRLAETCNDMLARLETAVSQITRFTADASHELRSPLSFIRTVAEYALRRQRLDAETAEAFRDIVTESEAASRLLEDMLTLARADADRVETVFDYVDLAVVTESAASKMRALADEDHVFTTEIAEEPLWVMGDGTSLSRLVKILIDNAIKYTPAGGSVIVSVAGTEREVVLEVRDNGVGIPAAALPRIFERFFRVDPSRGQQEGVGLGLAIGKWIADVHRGRITVESQEGAGSTFRVTFPRVAVTDSLQADESFAFSSHSLG
jgi:heavy metal sensor kinase